MTPRAETGKRDLQSIVVGVRETQWWIVVDLQGHMGSKAQLWILGQRPILDPQRELHLTGFQQSSIRGADQFKSGGMAAESCLQLLNRARRTDFLKSPRR